MRRTLATFVLLLLGCIADAGAQGRVVPEPAPTRRRVVPAPRQQPRTTRQPATQPRPRTVAPPPPASAPVVREVAAPPAPASVRAGPLTVTLVTFGVGDAVWERFGHNALWIHDARTRSDVAYNWGLFDFEQPGFFRRFLTGDTRYWMGGEDAFAMISAYRAAGRTITLQKLNLTPAQTEALDAFVKRNAQEANKYYRYDYFRDNCSTRLRDALDRSIDGALREATDTMRTALTYRGESVRLTEGQVPVQTGIDIALGQPADRPLTGWESFFVPMRLRDAVRIVRVPAANGETVPLVAEERVLEPGPGAPQVVEARTPPDHSRRNLLAGASLAALVALVGFLMRSRRWAAWIFTVLSVTWSLLCGVLGVVLLLAWMATKHEFWARNENLLVLSPLSLLMVVFIPTAVLVGRSVRRARIIGFLLAAMALAALALSLAPGGQQSREVVMLLMPTHLALALALLLSLSRRDEPKPARK
jgi:hypothetical protein